MALTQANPWVLALDLEGTLISNAVSVFVRPGLHRFLVRGRALVGRVVAFTTVKEARFREIARLLVQEGSAPAWFADVGYVRWAGRTKNLSFIPGAAVEFTLLVDDMEQYVCAEQREQWIAINCFEPPFDESDQELDRVLAEIVRRTTA